MDLEISVDEQILHARRLSSRCLRDVWDSSPRRLNFAEFICSKEEKKSFVRVVREAMANRAKGRGPRTRNLDEEWNE